MSEWKRVKLGEVAKMMRGRAVTRSSIAPGDIPVMLGGREPAYYCSESNHTGPCFIVSRSGASAGYVSYWDEPIFVTDGFLFEGDTKSDTQFLYYSLKARQQSLIMSQNGTGIPHVRGEDLKNIELAFPTKEERKHIASILSDYDAAIANCRKQIALLEEAAMRLYREWFGDGKGERKTIGEVCSKIGSGGTPNRRNEAFWQGGDVLWVKTGELQDCWIFDTEEKITADGLTGSSAKMFPAETVMMAIYASPTLGHLGILDAPACCNQATLCLVADETVVSWQWLYCKLFELREEFNAIARGAGQQNISGVVVKTYCIVVPAYDKIKAFTSIVSPMFSETRSLGKHIRSLTEARDRLLPKLMSGEVAV